MASSSEILDRILNKFKEQGYSQVPGYYRFGYIRETNSAVIVSRETGQDTPIPKSKIEEAINAVKNDPSVYDSGPSNLRKHGITHINSPLWSLLHLVPLNEITD